MKKINYTFWIGSIIISIMAGDIVLNFLDKTTLNIWVSRIIGCIVAGVVELVLYNFWYKKRKNRN